MVLFLHDYPPPSTVFFINIVILLFSSFLSYICVNIIHLSSSLSFFIMIILFFHYCISSLSLWLFFIIIILYFPLHFPSSSSLSFIMIIIITYSSSVFSLDFSRMLVRITDLLIPVRCAPQLTKCAEKRLISCSNDVARRGAASQAAADWLSSSRAVE